MMILSDDEYDIRAQTEHSNSQNFQNTFFCKFYISPSILCQKFLQKNYCKVLFAIKVCTSLTYLEL